MTRTLGALIDDNFHAIKYCLLTHWGRVMHICVGNLTIIGPDNGLLPGRHQAIIWTNAGILLIGPWGTNFSEILIGIQTFSLQKMQLKMASAKWRPFCLGLNVLKLGFAVAIPGYCSCHFSHHASISYSGLARHISRVSCQKGPICHA